MRDKPIEISQGSLGSLRVAVPSPFPNVGGGGEGGRGGEGTGTRRVRPSADHCQFLHQLHLEVGDQVTGYA